MAKRLNSLFKPNRISNSNFLLTIIGSQFLFPYLKTINLNETEVEKNIFNNNYKTHFKTAISFIAHTFA